MAAIDVSSDLIKWGFEIIFVSLGVQGWSDATWCHCDRLLTRGHFYWNRKSHQHATSSHPNRQMRKSKKRTRKKNLTCSLLLWLPVFLGWHNRFWWEEFCFTRQQFKVCVNQVLMQSMRFAYPCDNQILSQHALRQGIHYLLIGVWLLGV